MAEHRLIDAYLAELRHRLRRLDEADDLVTEAADHLLTTAERLVATGVPPAEAERTALARYGPARRVAREFREQVERHGAVATRQTRSAGRSAMVSAAAVALTRPLTALPNPLLMLAGLLLGVVAIVTFFRAVIGVRDRHGRLGIWGRLAWLTFVAWMVLLFPLALLRVQWLSDVIVGASVCLAGVGLLRARILPAGAVVLATFAPQAISAASHVLPAGPAELAGSVIGLAGTAWIGWFMATEPALDEEAGGSTVAA